MRYGLSCIAVGWIVSLLALPACRDPLHRGPPAELEQRVRGIEQTSIEQRSTVEPERPTEADRPDVEALAPDEAQEESVELSVAELRRDLLRNHLDLRVELYEPAIAEQEVRRQRSAFEWSLFADSALRETEAPGFPAGPDTRSIESEHEIGLRIPTKLGTTAELSAPFTTQRLDVPGGEPEEVRSGLSFSIAQPLLRNAGERVNTAALRASRYRRRQVDARTKLTAIRLLAEAERAYWRMWEARRSLRIRHQQYERAREQIEDARELVDAGVVAEVEVTRAQAGAARRLEAIIRAEQRRRRVERQLKRILNRPDLSLGSAVALAPATEPRPVRLSLKRGPLIEKAMAERMDLLETELQLTVEAIESRAARQWLLPIFAMDFRYTFRGAGDRFGGSVDSFGANEYPAWRAGVRAEIPLGNEEADAELRQAVLRRLQTLTRRDQRRLKIREEVHDALDQLELTWQRILSARQETARAASIYQAERQQFRAGLRTSTEVIEAANFLAQAQLREVQALADYEVAKIEIAFASGTVLGHGRIELGPIPPDRPKAAADALDPLAPLGPVIDPHRGEAMEAADPPLEVPRPTPEGREGPRDATGDDPTHEDGAFRPEGGRRKGQ